MTANPTPGNNALLSSGISLLDELGLVWPKSGSLGWRFIAALAVGSVIGVFIGLQTPGPVITSWVVLASLLLWQPIIEEVLFRGLLQGFLASTGPGDRTLVGVSLANLVTSCIFVLVHLVHQPPAWALAVIFPSLVFGYFRDRSASIGPALLLHVAFNAAFFLP